jgi:hypothetical protein
MDYFWKENRTFLVATAGAVLAVILYNAFVLAPLREGARAAAARRERERRDLEARAAQGVPSEETLRLARAEREQGRKVLAALVADTAFRPAERFRKPAEGARAHYEDLKIKLGEELRQKAVKARIALAPFSISDEGAEEERVAENLLRLAAVERLATLAIESEVDRIEAIDASAGPASREDDPSGRKASFVTPYGIFMKFAGKAESVFKVLHGAQKKGQYLAVTQFEARRSEASKDLYQATMTVAILRVDEKAPVR